VNLAQAEALWFDFGRAIMNVPKRGGQRRGGALLAALIACLLALLATAAAAQSPLPQSSLPQSSLPQSSLPQSSLPQSPLLQMLPVPQLKTRVTDLAGLLQAGERAALEQVLAEQERTRGNQIAILLVKRTEPETLDAYSIRVAEAWKLGRKGVDDGVLLIIAKDNPKALRRMRLEVGRGVQGVLTDAQSKRILQDTMAPYFRKNEYYAGLMAGVTALDQVLARENLPPVTARPHTATGAGQDDVAPGAVLGWIGGLLAVIVLLGKTLGGRRGTYGGRGHHNGLADNLSGVLLGAALSSLSRGHSGSSGSFGGSDSGGGFSGGGGSFDGGGASGDW
jgi:uncharacterized protein